MKLAIAIPTYNEAANVKRLLPSIKNNLKSIPDLSTTLFVIDDNSPDKTGDLAESIGKEISTNLFKVKVIHRQKKEGLGKAYVFAFHKILNQNFDYILQMDADFSHDPKYLKSFIKAAAESADFVVGSRYIKGGATPDWQWHRKFLSRAGNTYSRMLLSSKIADYTGGYNLYSSDLLRSIDLDSLQAGGYGFLIELKYKALNHCSNVVQVPIVFMDRKHGESKIPRGIIIKNLLLVTNLRFNEASKIKT